MRVTMRHDVEIEGALLLKGETVEVSDAAGDDWISRGYAEPEVVETRRTTKKGASRG